VPRTPGRQTTATLTRSSRERAGRTEKAVRAGERSGGRVRVAYGGRSDRPFDDSEPAVDVADRLLEIADDGFDAP
jgi:hypothetical protein